jgi:hypothetical protein
MRITGPSLYRVMMLALSPAGNASTCAIVTRHAHIECPPEAGSS